MLTETQKRILGRWKGGAIRNNTLSGGELGITAPTGINTYSGSSVTNTNSDFLGDWRSADSWMRFDMYRVRARSRQLERGNPWCKQFARALCNNVLGAKGFHFKPKVVTGKVFGDSTDGEPDEFANLSIQAAIDKQGSAANFTTRKRLSRREVDRLILVRLAFDGEVILRKIRNFDNECGFAWQIVDPDYLDQNLNRVEPNGNITKMGVELDKEWKFPVAYWILHRRPNDFFYNYTDLNQQRYIRVPAEEILHIFVQTDDPEQTRGWPWIFAAVVNLFRQGKFEEAALINATIGASKAGFYKKTFPNGFEGDPADLDDNGRLVMDCQPGEFTELPYGVELQQWNPTYPEADFEPFNRAMLRSAAATFGTSYATTSGDLSEANFVSSRLGQLEERENYMAIQEFLIEKWKIPAFDEELYRAMLTRAVPLPIAKFAKFNAPHFTGRRWPYVQPIQDQQAKTMALDNCSACISDIIEETTGESGEEMFKKIAADNKLMEKYGLKRVHSSFQLVGDPAEQEQQPAPAPAAKPKE